MAAGIIIQARRSSTRLPDKILRSLPFDHGVTVLQQVIRRAKNSKRVDEVVVATTTDAIDEIVVDIAKMEQVKCFQGSRDNVLERYFFAAKRYQFDPIIRVTSDCPCLDPEIIDFLIEQYKETRVDYISNSLSRTFPRGMDVEVFSFKALEKTFREAKDPSEKEHVTLYMYQPKSEHLKIKSIEAKNEWRASDIRVTLDTLEDYALLCIVFDILYKQNEFFGLKDLIKLFSEKPWLKLINSKVMQKENFSSLEEEAKRAIELLELHDLKRISSYIMVNFTK